MTQPSPYLRVICLCTSIHAHQPCLWALFLPCAKCIQQMEILPILLQADTTRQCCTCTLQVRVMYRCPMLLLVCNNNGSLTLPYTDSTPFGVSPCPPAGGDKDAPCHLVSALASRWPLQSRGHKKSLASIGEAWTVAPGSLFEIHQ